MSCASKSPHQPIGRSYLDPDLDHDNDEHLVLDSIGDPRSGPIAPGRSLCRQASYNRSGVKRPNASIGEANDGQHAIETA